MTACLGCSKSYPKTDEVPEWLYSNYSYWTMAKDETNIWYISSDGIVFANKIWADSDKVVRPVVTFSKSAL